MHSVVVLFHIETILLLNSFPLILQEPMTFSLLGRASFVLIFKIK